jgi:hypothetical protein
VLALHLDRLARVVPVERKRRDDIAPSTPTRSIAATISSPVTRGGQFGTLGQGRFGVFAS